jgi:hypothetical protein
LSEVPVVAEAESAKDINPVVTDITTEGTIPEETDREDTALPLRAVANFE